MTPLLLTSDIVFIELNACHNLSSLFGSSMIRKSCCMSLLALSELFDFELILVSFVWWEGNLSLIHVVEHSRLFHVLVLSVAKTGLINCLLVYP